MFGAEPVLLVEIQVPSLRVAVQHGLIEVEATKIRLLELKTLIKSRLVAQQQLELYKVCMARA